MESNDLAIALVDNFNKAEKSAFTEIYKMYAGAIYRYVYKLIKQVEKSEDITADVFIKLWNGKGSFKSITHIKNFLYIVARNASFNHLQSSEQRIVDLQGEVVVDLVHENPAFYDELTPELIYKISDSIEELSKSRKAVIKTILKNNWSDKQVAEHLNIEEKTVRNTKNTAIYILRQKLLFKSSSDLQY